MKRIAGFLLPLLLGACSSEDSNEAGPGADDGGGGGPDAMTGGNEGGDPAAGPFEVGVSVVDVSPTAAELANGDIYMSHVHSPTRASLERATVVRAPTP